MMRAMTLHAPGEALRLEERPDLDPAAGEVQLKVQACAVCRTDLHIVDGELPRLPVVPGHEIVGIVDRLATRVAVRGRRDARANARGLARCTANLAGRGASIALQHCALAPQARETQRASNLGNAKLPASMQRRRASSSGSMKRIQYAAVSRLAP